MKLEDYNILDQQEKEAKKLGFELDSAEEEEDKEEKPKEKQEEKPDEKIEEEKPESEKKDEEDSEDDEADKNPQKRPSKGSLQQEAFKQREQKRLQGIVSEQITAALNPITEMLKELKEARTPAEKVEVQENIDAELQALADNEKIPIEQFKKITALITKQVQATIAPQLKKVDDIAPILEKERQQDLVRQAEETFKTEWEGQAEPLLTEQYKNANATQMKQARELLKELAVSPDYGDTRGNKEGLPEHPAYPVDYIIYKEAEKFDTILNTPRKKSFESSSSITDEANDNPTKLEDLYADKEIKSAAEAIKLSKDLDKAIGKERTVVMREGVQVDVTD